jgi:hypothetical protein
MKARINITLFRHCKNIELIYDGSQVAKPKTSFVLDKNEQLLVYQWLKSVRFPDGYASNISRLVNLEGCKLYGIKSHNCHVFMQTLIPLAYWDLLPNGIWDTLIEISHLFRDICFNKLHTQYMERLEMNIIQTIYKLEMILLLSLYESIEYLSIHLPFKARVGDLVQYRWMYSFERLGITHAS